MFVSYDGATDMMDVDWQHYQNPASRRGLFETTIDLAFLGDEAFFGFTGGTGGLSANQFVGYLDLTVDTPALATPLPAAAWLFGTVLAGAGVIGYRKKKA